MSWSSGTNSIKEGGTAKNLTLQMLEVHKQSGGTEYFVRKSDVTLGTKSISQNGTYTAASDGKYGFSQVTVNVRGGNGSADSSGKPTGTIAPGGAGSAVVGTDTTTGNEQVVGVDSSGNLVQTPLPSSIVLVTNPTKLSYTDGESIDLTGAVVTAKNADGTTWTDADHPNGHIALSELIVDPTTADASKASAWWIDPGWSVNAAGTYLGFVNDRQFYKANDGLAAAAFRYGMTGNGWVSPILISTDPDAVAYHCNNTYLDYESSFTYQGLTFYWNGRCAYHGTNNFGSVLHFVDEQDAVNQIMEHVHVNGSGEDSQTITLNWARPADGKILSTTMQITVTGSSSTTESSSGTSGSGGGGTF